MEKVIFDCDNTLGLPLKEIDDGLTLYYLLGRGTFELLGITTTFGNGTIDQVYSQTLQLQEDLGLKEIPVLKGAGARGESGTPAAQFLAEAAAAHPGEISLLATGPLGNLRGAYELDPNFFKNLKQVAVMGGYLGPVRMGYRQVSELNLSADPEASHLVLNSGARVVLFNAQTCLQAPFRWADLFRLNFWSLKTRWAVARWLVLHAVFCGLRNFYLWDLLPAVYLSDPGLFEDQEVQVVSTLDDLTEGRLVVGGQADADPVVMPSQILDYSGFKEVLFQAWRRMPV
jgi:inosine-uridine nucleoside N-ribohydrolase